MQIVTINNSYHYETENLLRVFFPEKKFLCVPGYSGEGEYCLVELDDNRVIIVISADGYELTAEKSFDVSEKVLSESDEAFFERKAAIMLFELLRDKTGYVPPWGILTGVRPAKLMTKLISSMGKREALDYFISELRVTPEKALLAQSVAFAEAPLMEKSQRDSFSLYVSIPFCPSRCSYCSFISHSNESAKKLIPDYVERLCDELAVTGEIARKLSLRLESIYIGGGTPTVLTAQQLKTVTDKIRVCFDFSCLREYTVEAGRPDSITEEKLKVIKGCGCTRISINPQTFSDDVLKVIGRNHTSQMTEESMLAARREGFDNINMDLIAGLPTDTVENFERTLDKALSFEPENITVHTLALKRSSNIVTKGEQTNSGDNAAKMLSIVQQRLTEKGYIPYYMYRQSKSLGNLENVGWAKKGYEGLYNVYMMEECHTILSVGAGAVIKLRKPDGKEIERIFNYKYPYEYISGFEEIIKRKDYIYEFYNN